MFVSCPLPPNLTLSLLAPIEGKGLRVGDRSCELTLIGLTAIHQGDELSRRDRACRHIWGALLIGRPEIAEGQVVWGSPWSRKAGADGVEVETL